MADVFGSQSGRSDPPDGDDLAPCGQGLSEREPGDHLSSGRGPVRALGAGMGRDDVPEQHLALQAELGQDAVDDRRRGLGRAGARELALGREGDAADAGTAVAGGFADEDDLRIPATLEIAAEPVAQQGRRGVLVVRLPDLRVGEPLDEVGASYSHSIVAGGFDVTSSTTRLTPGISFTSRAEIVSTRSYGSRAQSAVIASSLVTARITIG